jgi:hypothetical protein
LVFFMVSPPFKGFGQPRRDDPDCIASHRIGNEQQSAFDHANRREPLLALVLSVISPIEGNGSLNTSRAASNVTPCLA